MGSFPMNMELNHHVKDEFNEINLQAGQLQTVINPYKHKWTLEQRVTLAMLAENYSNNWKDLTCVFNQFHAPDLQECGGLRTAVVSTQFGDMRRYFDAEASMRELQATLSPCDRLKLASRAQLEEKAKEIGVQLIALTPTSTSNRLRLFNSLDASKSNKRKRDTRIDDARTDYLSDEEKRTAHGFQTGHGLFHLPKTPTKQSGRQQLNGLLTPPDSKKRKIARLTTEKKLAGIGFRAFTAQSQGIYSSALGIRAGAFLNCPNIPLARDLTFAKYREEAL